MDGIFLTPLTEFFELDFALHTLPVLSAPVIDPFAGPASQLD